MKFSVVIPAYNAEKYMEQTLGNLLKQTYKDFEVIVVDDCATDTTGQIAEAFQKIYAHGPMPLKVLHKIQNEGLSMARNTGMECAGGDYILFLDADDSVEPDLLEKINEALRDRDADFLVYGYTEDYYQGDKLVYQVKKIPEGHYYVKMDAPEEENQGEHTHGSRERNEHALTHAYPYIASLERDTMFGYAWNKVYRLAFLKENNLKFEKVTHIEDVLFNLQVAEKMESMAVVPEALYHYRNEGQQRLTGKYLPEYFSLQKRRCESFLEMQENKLTTEKQERRHLTNREIYQWENLVKETISAAYFRSFQSYLVREILHGTSKEEIIKRAKEETESPLFSELQRFVPGKGKAAKLLYEPLAKKDIKTAYQRAKMIGKVQKKFPALYAKLKQNR